MKPFTGAEEAEDWRLRNCATCPFSGSCPLERSLDIAAEADGDVDLLTLARTGLLNGPTGHCEERQAVSQIVGNNATRSKLFNG